jgi:hypothetical protein
MSDHVIGEILLGSRADNVGKLVPGVFELRDVGLAETLPGRVFVRKRRPPTGRLLRCECVLILAATTLIEPVCWMTGVRWAWETGE